MWCCLRDPTFSHSGTIPASDRHTDRHAMMAITRASLAQVKTIVTAITVAAATITAITYYLHCCAL